MCAKITQHSVYPSSRQVPSPCTRWLVLGSVLLTSALQAADNAYLTDVKPLFETHCYRCHTGDQPKSELRLDTGVSALKGGARGPAIIPGNAADSPLLAILRGTHDTIPQMPYRDTPLSADAIERIAAWIDAGAEVPEDETAGTFLHWAFVPPKRPEVPSVPGWDTTVNPIDRFIQARLPDAGLAPAPAADRETLIRRLHLDVVGLPPEPEAIDTFVRNPSPQATEKLVDQLLHSPHFGERWGRHWLDLARYADSNGYSIDGERSIWRYRDYVIQAINQNLPFDQFVTEQLAGDLLPAPTRDQLIATGFHRNTQINQEGGIDKEQFRIESVVDRVATTSTAFLGLTLACAQCHDHKFDPFSQEEYYQLFAYFNNQDEPTLDTPQPGELEARVQHQESLDQLAKAIQESESQIQERIFDWEKYLSESDLKDLDGTYRAILTKPRELRTPEESKSLFTHFKDANEAHQKLMKEQQTLKRRRPRLTTTMVLRERKEPRQTFVHIKGDFTRKGDRVASGTPTILGLPTSAAGGDRLALSQWLTNPNNPLLARVTVNRIWQQYFGRGIVETENDFGTQGIPPTHPELLDWLAVELIESGWNVKHMHRLILLSRTYQQSSRLDAEKREIDPANRFFSRQSRMRLEAEVVRDVALAAAGLLQQQIGGPSVRPPQPDGVMKLGQVQRSWRPSRDGDRFRRGIYTFYYRATPHPALAVFDSPDAFSACSRRIRSNTPLQALTMLNDPAFHEMAQALGNEIASWEAMDADTRIQTAFRRCLGRSPTPSEARHLSAALQHFQTTVAPDAQATEPWFALARILLNLDETITRE